MYARLASKNFIIVSIAFDHGGVEAVRPFIRPAEPIDVPPPMREIMGWTAEEYRGAAAPEYPCLIDEHHVVADLYDMPNVPMAVWIDENGRIVRPAEAAGATDGFRSLDRKAMKLDEEKKAAGRAARAAYIAAIEDWVERGDASRFALAPEEIERRAPEVTDREMFAATCFRLALDLRERGEVERARVWFDEASRAAPDRWTYFRQALELEGKGNASGPAFFAAVGALGDRPYYKPANLGDS